MFVNAVGCVPERSSVRERAGVCERLCSQAPVLANAKNAVFSTKKTPISERRVLYLLR